MKSDNRKNVLLVGERINTLLLERNLSLGWLAKEIKVRKAILALYINAKRIPDVTTIEKIAKALGVSKAEILSSVKDSSHVQFSKYDLIEIFIDSLNEFQRRSSFVDLGEKDFKTLLDLTAKLGGWRKVLKILDREVFEMGNRESSFMRNKTQILQESIARSRPVKTSKKRAV